MQKVNGKTYFSDCGGGRGSHEIKNQSFKGTKTHVFRGDERKCQLPIYLQDLPVANPDIVSVARPCNARSSPVQRWLCLRTKRQTAFPEWG